MVPFPLHLYDPKDLANDYIRVRKSLDSLDGQKAIAEAARTSHKYRLRQRGLEPFLLGDDLAALSHQYVLETK